MDGSHANTLWLVTNTCVGAISVGSVLFTHWLGSGGASVSSQVARRLPLSFYAGGDAYRCSREEIAEEIDVILLLSFSPSTISVFSFSSLSWLLQLLHVKEEVVVLLWMAWRTWVSGEREGIIVTGSDGCLLWNDRWCGGEVLADGFL